MSKRIQKQQYKEITKEIKAGVEAEMSSQLSLPKVSTKSILSQMITQGHLWFVIG
jgi:hypothetical protein